MKWVLVTGGAKRIGAEICKTLAQEGYDVLVHYRTSKEEAHAVAQFCREKGVQAECLQGDFLTETSTKQFIQKLSRFSNIHHLINNVGNYRQESLIDTSPEEWMEQFQINLHAPYACIQAVLPSLKLTQGSIINIGTSGITFPRSSPHAPTYRATKSALLFLTKQLARELAPFQVRVNMVSPGQLEISQDKPQDLKTIPMLRLGTVEEVTRVVLFLLHPDSAYITGQNIEVAGGLGI